MNDESIMPFGKYKGTRMIDVPAGYLMWFHLNVAETSVNEPVHSYIKDNLDVIQSEINQES